MQRLKEGSTWAGFGIFFQVAKGFFPQYALILDGASGVAAAIAAAIPDKTAAVK